jgi:GDP-L-fucose synthase
VSDFAIGPIDRDAKVHIAGHRGLVGSALVRRFETEGFTNLVLRTSSELDLTDRAATKSFMESERHDVVIDAAAKVGGILANNTSPADFISQNIQIQVNLMDAAAAAEVPRLLFLGSSCIYPKFAEQPIREDSLLTGPLEPTNDAYAIAKIAGIMQVQAVRRQHGLPWISAMPTNLYGPNDNFDLETSHVLPAMIRRFHEAKEAGDESVMLWGTGSPLREFLHVDDLASACLFLLENWDSADTVNLGVGSDISIRELAELVAGITGYQGQLEWDESKPDGTPRKLLDVSRLSGLGWQASIGLHEGISATYEWYLANQ